MAEIRLYLDDKQIELHENWRETKIVLNWKTRKEFDVDISTLVFKGESAKLMIARAEESYFEGSRLRMEFGSVTDPIAFDLNVDYSDNFVVTGCDECSVKVRKEQGYDWTIMRGDSTSFPLLYDTGVINDSDFVKVPYVINYIPDGLQIITLSISIFMLTKETIDTVKSISETTKETIEAIVPGSPSPIPSWPLGNIIGLALKGIIETLEAVALSIAIAKLVKAIKEELLPAKRYHLGMKVSTLLSKGCDGLDLGFKSEQLEKYGDLVLIPSKGFKGGSPNTWDRERGFPDSSFGTFIEAWKQITNSDFKIDNGILNYERIDYWRKESDYQNDDIYNDQETYRHVKKWNTNEMKAKYSIEFSTDTQDQNTLDNQDRRIYENAITIDNPKDPKLVNLKGLQEVIIPYSLAVRKTKLNRVEKLVKNMLKISDKILGRSDAGGIKSRVGAMEMSSHFITRGKLVVMNGSELQINQRDAINSKLLWNNEHSINSFAPINGEHNQYVITEDEPANLCELKFKKLINNPYFPVKQSTFGKMDLVEWYPATNKGVLNYRINEEYAKNLTNNEV